MVRYGSWSPREEVGSLQIHLCIAMKLLTAEASISTASIASSNSCGVQAK